MSLHPLNAGWSAMPIVNIHENISWTYKTWHCSLIFILCWLWYFHHFLPAKYDHFIETCADNFTYQIPRDKFSDFIYEISSWRLDEFKLNFHIENHIGESTRFRISYVSIFKTYSSIAGARSCLRNARYWSVFSDCKIDKWSTYLNRAL